MITTISANHNAPRVFRGFGKTTLQEVALEGVTQAYGSHSQSAESKGVKAHFRMDESGILTIESVRHTTL